MIELVALIAEHRRRSQAALREVAEIIFLGEVVEEARVVFGDCREIIGRAEVEIFFAAEHFFARKIFIATFGKSL